MVKWEDFNACVFEPEYTRVLGGHVILGFVNLYYRLSAQVLLINSDVSKPAIARVLQYNRVTCMNFQMGESCCPVLVSNEIVRKAFLGPRFRNSCARDRISDHWHKQEGSDNQTERRAKIISYNSDKHVCILCENRIYAVLGM